MTLANAILNLAVALVFGAISGFVLAVIYRPWYHRKAEELGNLTAEEAQAFADVFSTIAQRLKAPGKAVIYRPCYHRKAEELRNLTAEEAQALADVFSTIAQRLRRRYDER